MLCLRTLGGLSLEMEGKPASGAAGQRAPLAILAFIAISGETGASRDRIAALFWPESDAERAHGSLKQALYSLRRDAKSQELFLGTSSLRLNPEIIRCDASDFRTAFECKNFEQAVTLYTGDFLDGVHLTGSDEFERWVDRERSIFAQQHSSALENLAGSAEARGEYSEATSWWRQLVTIDPFSTRLARKYIRALASSGDRKAAMDYAELHQRMIAVEMNAKPDSKLLELIDDIRMGRVQEVDGAPPVVVSRAVSPETVAVAVADSGVHSRRLRIVTAGIVAVAIMAAIMGLSRGRGSEWLHSMGIGSGGTLISTGQLAPNDRLLVADFRVSGLEPGVGTALAEAVRVSLTESRDVAVVQTSVINDALHRMKRATNEPLDLASSRELAVREGIPIVIAGDITRLGTGFLVGLHLIDASSGNTLASAQETVDGPRDLIPAVDHLARMLRSRIGESLKSVKASAPLMQVTTPSLEALQRYTEGMRANYLEQDFLKAVRLLEEALVIDREFAMAWRALGAAWANAGFGPKRADSAAAMAFQYRDRLTRKERHQVEAYYYWTAGHNRAKAARAYEALAEDDSVPNGNLAEIYLDRRDFARAENVYRKIIALSPDVRIAYNGLVGALANQGKLAQAESVHVLAQTRFPPSAPAVDQAATLLFMRGQLGAYRRRLDSLCLSQDPAVVRRAYDRLAAVAIMSGRIAEYERYRMKWRELQAAAGVGPPTLIRDSIYASVIDVALRRDTANAVRRLEATLANEVPKFATMPFLELLHMSRAYSQAGRPDRAREVLELYRRNLRDQVLLAAAVQPIIENVHGSVILADGKPRDAILIYRKSDMLPDGAAHECTICPLYNLGSAFDAAGMTDSAIVMFEAYVRTPYFSRLELRGWFDERAHPERLPLVYERLGNLYELKGDSSRAADNYSRFVELWKDADPELQPRVASARSRITALRWRGANPR